MTHNLLRFLGGWAVKLPHRYFCDYPGCEREIGDLDRTRLSVSWPEGECEEEYDYCDEHAEELDAVLEPFRQREVDDEGEST